MTAQFSEVLMIGDECLALQSLPLERYFSDYGGRPALHGNTALERGYIGTWAIEDGLLYLIKLDGEYSPERTRKLNLQDVFPGQQRVLAAWYSGVLRCPIGKRLKYVHMGFHSVYAQDRYLIIEKGHLIGEHLVANVDPREPGAASLP